MEGIFKEGRLAKGRLELPEATFEGRFQEEAAVIGCFEAGRVLFPNEDFAEVKFRNGNLVFASYYSTNSKRFFNFLCEEFKEYYGEEEETLRVLNGQGFTIYRLDRGGNLVKGVELSLLGLFKYDFDFYRNRVKQLEKLLKCKLVAREVPQEASALIDAEECVGRVCCFAFENMAGYALLSLDDLHSPKVGQGVYASGQDRLRFALLKAGDAYQFLVGLEFLSAEKF